MQRGPREILSYCGCCTRLCRKPHTQVAFDPKYDFEIFNDENSNDDQEEDDDFGVIDEFGNLATNNSGDSNENDNDAGESAVRSTLPFAICNDFEESQENGK